MTDDIVTRLQNDAERCFIPEVLLTYAYAVDEIERLRAELLEAQQGLRFVRRARDRRDDEIEHLVKEVEKWKSYSFDLFRALLVQRGMAFHTATAQGAEQRYEQAVRGEGRSDG